MKQMTLTVTKGFERHSRATHKAEFLARMESLMPGAEFCALIKPHYGKVGNPQSHVPESKLLEFPVSDIVASHLMEDDREFFSLFAET